MNLLFKLLLTTNTTSWMIIIYVIKERITIGKMPFWAFHLSLVFFVIILSWLSLLISELIRCEEIKGCNAFYLADNEFLPVYLGYFFVSLGVSDLYSMIAVYLLVFVFTYLSQTQYFNPVYLLLGYHFYHIETTQGTKVFIVKKGQVIRTNHDIDFINLRRLNDTTFIERR